MKKRNAIKYHEQVVKKEKLSEFQNRKSDGYLNN